MKHFICIFALISTLTLTANAEAIGDHRSSDFRSKIKYIPEILELKGIVKSDGNHQTDCDVDLELVETETGKTYSISEPGELAQLHCSKENDFLVTLKAERTSKFLFWGGNLEVQGFQVLEELETQPHIQTKNTREPSFDSGAGRR